MAELQWGPHGRRAGLMPEPATGHPPGRGVRARRALEERALNAWPALESVAYDGWVLRFSGGYTRRANAVIPWRQGRLPLAAKVEACERQYAGRGLPTVFKMLPLPGASGLDRLLHERGYAAEAETAVQVCDLGRLALEVHEHVLSWDQAVPAWVEAYSRCSGASAADEGWLARIAARVVAPQCCAVLMADGQPACCGMGVLEDGWLGIFCLVTHPQWRRQGLARQLMAHLGRWASQHGGHGAYLQVTVDNGPACHLYTRLGFAEVYRYRYRLRPLAADPASA